MIYALITLTGLAGYLIAGVLFKHRGLNAARADVGLEQRTLLRRMKKNG